MGWSSGSDIAEDIWRQVRKYVPDNKQKALARRIIKVFESHDADSFEADMDICKVADLYQNDEGGHY